MSLLEAVCHPRVHVHRAGRSDDEQIKVETDLSIDCGGVAVALASPTGSSTQ